MDDRRRVIFGQDQREPVGQRRDVVLELRRPHRGATSVQGRGRQHSDQTRTPAPCGSYPASRTERDYPAGIRSVPSSRNPAKRPAARQCGPSGSASITRSPPANSSSAPLVPGRRTPASTRPPCWRSARRRSWSTVMSSTVAAADRAEFRRVVAAQRSGRRRPSTCSRRTRCAITLRTSRADVERGLRAGAELPGAYARRRASSRRPRAASDRSPRCRETWLRTPATSVLPHGSDPSFEQVVALVRIEGTELVAEQRLVVADPERRPSEDVVEQIEVAAPVRVPREALIVVGELRRRHR